MHKWRPGLAVLVLTAALVQVPGVARAAGLLHWHRQIVCTFLGCAMVVIPHWHHTQAERYRACVEAAHVEYWRELDRIDTSGLSEIEKRLARQVAEAVLEQRLAACRRMYGGE